MAARIDLDRCSNRLQHHIPGACVRQASLPRLSPPSLSPSSTPPSISPTSNRVIVSELVASGAVVAPDVVITSDSVASSSVVPGSVTSDSVQPDPVKSDSAMLDSETLVSAIPSTVASDSALVSDSILVSDSVQEGSSRLLLNPTATAEEALSTGAATRRRRDENIDVGGVDGRLEKAGDVAADLGEGAVAAAAVMDSGEGIVQNSVGGGGGCGGWGEGKGVDRERGASSGPLLDRAGACGLWLRLMILPLMQECFEGSYRTKLLALHMAQVKRWCGWVGGWCGWCGWVVGFAYMLFFRILVMLSGWFGHYGGAGDDEVAMEIVMRL